MPYLYALADFYNFPDQLQHILINKWFRPYVQCDASFGGITLQPLIEESSINAITLHAESPLSPSTFARSLCPELLILLVGRLKNIC